MAGQLPGVGEDVTALMGGAPEVGEDVTALMGGDGADEMAPVPSHGEDDALEQRYPGLRAITDDFDRKRNEAAPSANAAGMAMLAGPGIVPAAIVAGGARFLGERERGKSREDAAGAGMTEGLATGLMGGLTKIPAAMGKLGRRAIKGALKVDRGYLQNMATARKQGLMGAEDEIVDTVLEEGVNPVTNKGADRIQRRIGEVAGARTAKINAAPNRPVAKSGASQTQVLNRRLSSEMDATQSEGVDATRKIMRDLSANPRYGANSVGELADLTPREMARRVEADNSKLRSMFGKEQAPGVEAVKDVRGINARMLDRAAGTKAESQQMKRLIDLRNVSNIARRRGEARDVVGITDVVSLSAGRPEVLGATTAMRPAVQAQIGLTLDKIRRGIPLKGTAEERAALQAIVESMMAPSHGQE